MAFRYPETVKTPGFMLKINFDGYEPSERFKRWMRNHGLLYFHGNGDLEFMSNKIIMDLSEKEGHNNVKTEINDIH